MHPLPDVLAVSIPSSFALAIPLVSLRDPFRWPTRASYLALALAFGALVVDFAPSTGLVRLDAVARVMLMLVCFVAVVIVRYSRPYLDRDPGQARYARSLLATLTAATLLVITSNLIVIAIAWMATSLALHRLLTFYRARPRALVAAHKKFLVSRLADGCMLGALVVLASSTRRFDLDALDALVSAGQPMSASMQLAAVLLVIAVSLKSAASFPWLAHPGHGGTNARVGSAPRGRRQHRRLRDDSTRAVHGACGDCPGLARRRRHDDGGRGRARHDDARQHQADARVVDRRADGIHAGRVRARGVGSRTPPPRRALALQGTRLPRGTHDGRRLASEGALQPSLLRRIPWVLGVAAIVFVIVMGSVAAGASVFAVTPSPVLVSLSVVLGLSLVPLFVRAIGGGVRALVALVVRGLGVVALYFLGHAGAARILCVPEPAGAAGAVAVLIACFFLLFGVQMVLEYRPDSRVARALRPRLYAGLYLDEIFTRLTFRIWPPRRETSSSDVPALQAAEPLEVR